MAPIIELALELSLPKLLALDQNHDNFDERIQEAAKVAGVSFLPSIEPKETGRISQPRSEFVLRWILEKLKTPEGREEFRKADSVWDTLDRLVEIVPLSTIARLFQSSQLIENLKSYLQEAIGSRKSDHMVVNKTSNGETGPSKKRKRGEEEPSYLEITSEKAILGIAMFLKRIIALSKENTDGTSREYAASVLRISATEAAEILSLWLNCVATLFSTTRTGRKQILVGHVAFLHIWHSRSCEVDDELGASTRVFSATCLVPAVALLSKIYPAAELQADPVKDELRKSLEQLIAQHVYIPAHITFDAAQATRRSDLTRAQAALRSALEPLRAGISTRIDANMHSEVPIGMLPVLLDLAIRLCPTTTSAQKSAVIPWIESVFALLSNCAGEPVPHDSAISMLRNTEISPLQSLLNVLEKGNLDLSSDFLESVLIGYSGLKGLRKDEYPLRLDIVAALLKLNGGNFFVKSKDGPGSGGKFIISSDRNTHSKYVEALMSSLSEIGWKQETITSEVLYPFATAWTQTPEAAVKHVLVPLLHAYSASRKLASFTSLWFWEARRHWATIGTAVEYTIPWFSERLLQAFKPYLESTMVPTRIGELLIEYILPIKLLADEVDKISSQPVKWDDIPACASATAALVILEALLYSIDKEEVLHQNLTAWTAIKELAFRYARFDLDGFPAAMRVWTILTKAYRLSYWVDGKKIFLDLQRELIEENSTFRTAVVIANMNMEVNRASNAARSKEVTSAYLFLLTVCSYELERSLLPSVQAAIADANKDFSAKLEALPSNPDGISRITLADIERLRETIIFMLQESSVLLIFPSQERRKLFRAMFLFAAGENGWSGHEQNERSFSNLLRAMIESLKSRTKGPLDDMLHVLVTALSDDSVLTHQRIRVLDVLLTIPSILIPRARREAIIDNISTVENIRAKADGTEEEKVILVSKTVILLIRLLEVPNQTAKLCIDPNQIIALATEFDNMATQGGVNIDFLKMGDRLFELVLKQAVVDATPERRDKFNLAYLDIVQSDTRKEAAIKSNASHLPQPAANILSTRWLIIVDDISTKLNTLEFSHDIIMALKLASTGPTQVFGYDFYRWAFFHTIALLSWTCSGKESAGLTPALKHLTREAKSLGFLLQPKTALASTKGVVDPAAIEFLKIQSIADLDLTHVSEEVAQTLGSKLSAQDNCLALEVLEHRLKTSKSEGKALLAIKLLNAGRYQHMQMLHTLIRTLSSEDSASFKDNTDLLVNLCTSMTSSTEVGLYGAAMSCINTILRAKPELATQHGLDTLICTLARLASPQAPSFPSQHAKFIYLRLCEIMNSVILLHRRKLGGRMHLIVSLLQNLLSCLFTPHRYSQASLPSWLPKANLSLGHVEAYSRILTTLCSPTVSSAKKFGSNELVDETKKAKEYAGQYVSHVLLHYCTLQLHGKIAPEMKDKLKPGLWAVMEVVDIEAMRGMNAGMGRDERVIWGSVYSEWQKFGRFKLA